MFDIEQNEGFKTSLWVEKFRPKHVKDCILPNRLKEQFMAMVESGECQSRYPIW